MAEIRVSERDDDTLTRPERLAAGHALPGGPEMSGAAVTDSDHLLPARATPSAVGQVAATDDPDVARAEIEQTRARMSSTIDTIEEVLLRKKEQIQERLDVMAPVRQNPLPAAGVVFGAGLLLGLLTGGGDDHDHGHGGAMMMAGGAAMGEGGGEGGRWRSRNASLKARTRELERVVKQQRKELSRLRAEVAAAGMATASTHPEELGYDGYGYEEEEQQDRGGLAGVRDTVAAGVGAFFSRVLGGGSGEELEVEVELEERPSYRAGAGSDLYGGPAYGGQVDPAYGDNPERGTRYPGGQDQVHG